MYSQLNDKPCRRAGRLRFKGRERSPIGSPKQVAVRVVAEKLAVAGLSAPSTFHVCAPIQTSPAKA
jgi:hypothetical protein